MSLCSARVIIILKTRGLCYLKTTWGGSHISCCWSNGTAIWMCCHPWVRFKQFSDHVLTYPRQIWLLHFAGKGIKMFINDNGLVLAWYLFIGHLAARWTWIRQWSMWLIVIIICKNISFHWFVIILGWWFGTYNVCKDNRFKTFHRLARIILIQTTNSLNSRHIIALSVKGWLECTLHTWLVMGTHCSWVING